MLPKIQRSFYKFKNKKNRIVYEYNLIKILEFNKDTKNLVKKTVYYNNTPAINYIEEYDPNTKILIKKTVYHYDGKNIDYIKEFDKNTGESIKLTEYQTNNNKIISFTKRSKK
ncbi:DUF2963 domain-containing protein [Candidatus Phytoplasma prunorum]|uniref:DUF2963 domain-containing protein n=1 Tax=Candidatus Phytoplasma prunorum TaxID=47565 RepID=UPI002FEFAE37